MKVLLTGGSGQLASQLIISKPKSTKIIKSSRSELDVTCKDSCFEFVSKNKPDWIINCAAYTNVDKAETDFDLAYATNALAPKYLSEACGDYGGDLIHISSDYVFSGENEKPYLPKDKKSPINKYGLTKSIGEDFVLKNLGKSNRGIILRTSWLMGAFGNNFALKMLSLFSQQKELNVVCDQFSSPTSTTSLANACWKIIERKSNNEEISPILHYCDKGLASWYDVAIFVSEIGQKLNIIKTNEYKINPIKTHQYPTPAKRPKFSQLDCKKSLTELFIKAPHWKESLEEELKKYCFNLDLDNIRKSKIF